MNVERACQIWKSGLEVLGLVATVAPTCQTCHFGLVGALQGTQESFRQRPRPTRCQRGLIKSNLFGTMLASGEEMSRRRPGTRRASSERAKTWPSGFECLGLWP